MTNPFFLYPSAAKFGRVIPKNKIYEHSGANTRLKDLFVKQVEQIVWQCKLAPETINLPASPGVPEIQIFSLLLKTPELHRDVLRSIDGAIPFPIVFELAFEGKTQVIAAYKRPNESDASRWVLSDYFASAWVSPQITQTDADENQNNNLRESAQSAEDGVLIGRVALPVALDLGGLYEQVLHRLIPTPVRPQESLADLVARVELVAAKQRELDKTTARLEKEQQFNRKVEINAAVRQLRSELESLSR